MYKVRGLGACLANQVQDFKASVSKTLHLDRRSRPVEAKHSDRKSTVSAIGYCPNASPLLFQC